MGLKIVAKNDRRQFLKKTILKLLLVGFLKPWVNAIKILFHDNIGKKTANWTIYRLAIYGFPLKFVEFS